MRFKPKKRLGQNFLIDRNIRKKIIASCNLKPSDIVLEIGSGKGEITELISTQAKEVHALEVDPRLCEILKINTKLCKNIFVLNKDILKFNLKRYFKALPGKIKIVGNIPYYISSPIIEYILKNSKKIDSVFITVQKEFARRIAAKPGSKEYGSLSCFTQFYLEPRIIFIIKKTCFFPQPKVDSCFIELKIRREPAVRTKNEKLFFKVVRSAFGKRRKILKNSLKGVIPLNKLESFLTKHGLSPFTRPEELGLEDFAGISNL